MGNVNLFIKRIIDEVFALDSRGVSFLGRVTSDKTLNEKCFCRITLATDDIEEFTIEYYADVNDFRNIGKGIEIDIESNNTIIIDEPDYVYSEKQKELIYKLLSSIKSYKWFCESVDKFSRKNVIKRVRDLLNDGLIRWEMIDSEEIELDIGDVSVDTYKAEYGDEIYEYSAISDRSMLKMLKPDIEDSYDYDFYKYASPILKVKVGDFYTNSLYFLDEKEIREIFEEEERLLNYEDVLVRTTNKRCIELGHELIEVNAKVVLLKHVTFTKQEYDVIAYYCSECRRYYILEDEYKRLKSLGIICCKVVDINELNKSASASWADESVLMQCGYTVSQKVNLDSKARHSILNMVIYNEVMSRERIVDFLEWLVRKNSGSKTKMKAVMKWNADIDYLRYGDRPNPADFAIRTIFRK